VKQKEVFESEGCFVCGSYRILETHHVFSGPYRKKADKDGYVVTLCRYHHNMPPDGAHFNRSLNLRLKQIAQRDFEKTGTRDQFRERYGKSYL